MGSSEESISITEKGGVLVMAILAGEVTMFTAPEIREHVMKALEAKPKAAVMDLARVEYMDSSGIAIVFKAIQICTENAGKFAVCGLNKNLQKVMSLVTKTPDVAFFPTLEEAVKGMS